MRYIALVRFLGRNPTEAEAVSRKPVVNQYFGTTTANIAYMELKNELGICGDGRPQAALSFRKYVVQEYVELSSFSTFRVTDLNPHRI